MTSSPATPNVREMSRLALPLGTRLLGGALGLERQVRWARVGGVTSPIFPLLNADEVALLDLSLMRTSQPGLTAARMVRELGRLGIAAIVIKGEVDRSAEREADRSNLPLFVLPQESDVGRTARAIIRLISDREAQEEAQAATLYRLLSQGVAAGAGLEELVRRLSYLSGHAVRVSDLDGHVLARAGTAPGESVDLTRPLFVAGSPVAILALRDRPEALDRFARIALEQGAAALALELVKIEAVEAAREGVHGDFVATLLQGENDVLLLARARAADYPIEAVHWVLIAVAESSTSEESIREWARRATARADALGWQGRVHLSREPDAPFDVASPALPGGWSVTLVLAGGSTGWEPARDTFLDYLRERWPGPGALSMGAGDPARGLPGLRRALEEARDALSLGLRLFGAGRVYLHRDMGLYRLLRHLQGTEDLHHFLDRTLSALIRYDEEHDTGLLETLRVLLAHGGNISATAKAMHLHRNSLVYRLDRVREIAELDPTDPDDAFTLRLALMLSPLR